VKVNPNKGGDMKRVHTLFIALMLGAAASAGVLAATRTVDLGQAASPNPASAQAIAARSAKLDQLERSLQQALAKRPPELPKVPRSQHAGLASDRTASAQGGVVYVRPQAVVSQSPSSGEDEAFDEADEGADD
jgi:hypothetical protein